MNDKQIIAQLMGILEANDIAVLNVSDGGYIQERFLLVEK